MRVAAETSPTARELVSRLEAIADRALEYVLEMDFRFLYDDDRKLFAIGLRVPANELDPSWYDLLASEARLASFVAIAKGDVSPEHWFRLGRGLTENANGTALVSWSGSMFEYLMPRLVLQSVPFTLLDQTAKGAVARHIAWTRERNVPWGVSESAYNVRDRHLTYQYRAFGVPDLALKRGLSDDLVIAPYATALALAVTPESALRNLHALEAAGALGEYGFCDALDYTRPDPDSTHAVVRTWMAHHIGMSLVAIDNLVHREIWPRRFHSEPMIGSVELLLQERIPRSFVRQNPLTGGTDHAPVPRETDRPAVREITTPDTRQPRIALLGSLPYTVMITSGGGGYSRFERLAVTRWRADGTMDNWGQWCYLRDIKSGGVWSSAHQPTCRPAEDYSAIFATDRVEFHRRDGEIETRT
ncbi:MAG: glucoamylase family protein, partial [Gemmatimonadales bacterium]